ncbi:MAG: hypothetical protein ABL958_09990, partial [Bdellovibrionia bacterium]
MGVTRILKVWFVLSSLLLFSSANAQYRPFSDLTAGRYPDLAETLGEVSYEREIMYKIARPDLVFADEAWFTENGYDVSRGLTPATVRKILDALAYAAPVEGESPGGYLRERKTFFADYYGGDGTGQNFGSGRAVSKGRIQIKGAKRTQMVAPIEIKEGDHASGYMDSFEVLREVLGSQISHAEFPYGANRVVAVIATGTRVNGAPRFIVVREDPLRPGHFIENYELYGTRQERIRLRSVMEHLVDSLPQKPGSTFESEAEKLRAGLLESIERHARVSAYSYANHFYHSAQSPSNEGILGELLDFGAFMSFAGFPKAGNPEDQEFNSNTKAAEVLFIEFLKSLRVNLPAHLRGYVIGNQRAVELMRERFESHLNFEMTMLTGAPVEFVEFLRDSPVVRNMGKILFSMSRAGQISEQDALLSRTYNEGTYIMNQILKTTTALYLNFSGTEAGFKRALNR